MEMYVYEVDHGKSVRVVGIDAMHSLSAGNEVFGLGQEVIDAIVPNKPDQLHVQFITDGAQAACRGYGSDELKSVYGFPGIDVPKHLLPDEQSLLGAAETDILARLSAQEGRFYRIDEVSPNFGDKLRHKAAEALLTACLTLGIEVNPAPERVAATKLSLVAALNKSLDKFRQQE